MGMSLAHVPEKKICAFCRHWYDPTNSAIRPKNGGFWEFDNNVRKRCMKKVGYETQSWASCTEFECKV